jgi:hypothetical protein
MGYTSTEIMQRGATLRQIMWTYNCYRQTTYINWQLPTIYGHIGPGLKPEYSIYSTVVL